MRMRSANAVKELLEGGRTERFCLELIAGEKGLSRELTTSRIQKPGLLLTGLLEELHPDRIQIFGAAEIGYLNSLGAQELKSVIEVLEKPDIPAIIVTRGLEPPAFLVELCRKKNIPLLNTSQTSSALIEDISKYLEERLAPTTMLHGVLLDVLGVGIIRSEERRIGK